MRKLRKINSCKKRDVRIDYLRTEKSSVRFTFVRKTGSIKQKKTIKMQGMIYIKLITGGYRYEIYGTGLLS